MQRIRTPKTKLYYFLRLLSRKCGFAFPTNKYLANRYGLSVRTVQRYLRKLELVGLITIKTVRVGKFDSRQIYIAEQGTNNTYSTDFFQKLSPPYMSLYCYNKYFINNKKYNKKPVVFENALRLPLCRGETLVVNEDFVTKAQKAHKCNILAELRKIASWHKQFPNVRMGIKKLFAFMENWFLRNDNRISQQENTTADAVCVLPLCHERQMRITETMLNEQKALHNCDIPQEYKAISAWFSEHPHIRMTKRKLCAFIDKWLSLHDTPKYKHPSVVFGLAQRLTRQQNKAKITLELFKAVRAIRKGTRKQYGVYKLTHV